MRSEHKEWVNENPLRKYRRDKGLTLMEAAGTLGVALSTLHCWEMGVHSPSVDHFLKIKTQLGVTDIFDQWDEWSHNRPTAS